MSAYRPAVPMLPYLGSHPQPVGVGDVGAGFSQPWSQQQEVWLAAHSGAAAPAPTQTDAAKARGPSDNDCIRSDDGNELCFPTYDPLRLPPTAVCVAYGQRGSGKSALFLCWLYELRGTIRYFYAISGTDKENGQYRTRVPVEFCADELSSDLLERIWQHQATMLHDLPPDLAAAGWTKEDCTIRIMFDDCMQDEKELKSTELKRMLMNGRHMMTGGFFCVQYPKSLPPKLRTQAQIIVLFAEKDLTVLKVIWEENFRRVFPDWSRFQWVVAQCTKNHRALILDNTIKSENEMDKIFVYRADMEILKRKEWNPWLNKMDDWHLGADVMWPFHYRYWREPTGVKLDYSKGVVPGVTGHGGVTTTTTTSTKRRASGGGRKKAEAPKMTLAIRRQDGVREVLGTR